jgi:hypothetical protein
MGITKKIIIEGLQSGVVRISVEGPPYLATGGDDRTFNLSARDIAETWLSDFAPDAEEDRTAYSTGHCTWPESMHGTSKQCNGLCHWNNCSDVAVFFHRSKRSDGSEQCIPVCKWHGREMSYYIGQVVLRVLNFGVVEDLPFWKEQDPLPSGQPRCDYIYYDIDEWDCSSKARCTNAATTRVRTTERGPGGDVYDHAKLCDFCAERSSSRSKASDDELDLLRRKLEVTGPLQEQLEPGTPTSADDSRQTDAVGNNRIDSAAEE